MLDQVMEYQGKLVFFPHNTKEHEHNNTMKLLVPQDHGLNLHILDLGN